MPPFPGDRSPVLIDHSSCSYRTSTVSLRLQFWLQFTVVRWYAPTFTGEADLRQRTAMDASGERIPPS
jgi:hypothetical protein